MASQEPAFQTAIQQQQPPRTEPTQQMTTGPNQQMTMSPDIYGYAAAGGTEESDEYEEGGCNCAKTVFYIGLAVSALMVFWFCVLRVPMMTTPCPFQVTLLLDANGTMKTLPVDIAGAVLQKEKPTKGGECEKGTLQSAGVTHFLALINRRGQYGAPQPSNDENLRIQRGPPELIDALMNMNSYSINFKASGFLIDAAQTIVVVIACIALAPAVKCKVFKLLAMTCFIGIGLAFLIEAVQAIITIIFYFKIIDGANGLLETTIKLTIPKEVTEERERNQLLGAKGPTALQYSSDLAFLIFRFLQMAVELILAVLLILVAFLTCKAYSNELTASSQQNNGGRQSADGGGYQQYQPYAGPAVVQQNDKSKMRTYTQLEDIM